MIGKILSVLFLGFGIFALIQVGLPIINYQIWEFNLSKEDQVLISPQNTEVLGVSIEKQQDFPAFVSNLSRESKAPFEQFYLSVPSLKIDHIQVLVDSNDLSLGLVHLPGSALPGERGNIFISGHSALPLFFKGDKNLGSIFANLQNLKKGDQINLSWGGGEFNYNVVGFRVVNPNDLSVINPPSDGRFVSLMTCVPPGLNSKRLVVLGKLD